MAQRLWNQATGLLAACFVIIFVTLSPGGKVVNSELVALPGLMWSLSSVLRPSLRKRDLFIAGLMISIASLVRLNLAYVAVALGLLLSVRMLKQAGLKESVKYLGLYVAGGLAPIVLITIPYALAGELTTFIDAVIKAPLSYASSQKSAVESLASIVKSGFDGRSAPLLLGFIGATGLFCRPEPGRAEVLSPRKRWNLATLTCFGGATVWSVADSGGGYSHYVIQAIPFLALPAARFYVALAAGRGRIVRSMVWLALLVMLHGSTKGLWKDYGRTHAPTVEEKIARYLEKRNPDNRPVYFMTSHAAQWYLGTHPITRLVTHPTNIAKTYLLPYAVDEKATPERELKRIFAKKPLFVVTGEKTTLEGNAARVFRTNLKEHYRREKTIENSDIYVRVDSDGKR